MTLMYTVIGVLLLAGMSISLFVIFHMIRQNRNWLLPNKIAIAIQLLWITRFFLFYIKGPVTIIENPYVVIYDQTLFFLDGVLVWLYVRSLLRPDKSLKRVWVHFIPFGITFIYATVLATFFSDFVLEKYNQQMVDFQNGVAYVSTGEAIFILFLIVFNLIYLYKSEGITKSYNADLKENLSNVDHLTVNWIKRFKRLWIILFVVPFVLYFGNYIQPVFGQLELGNVLITLFVILSVVFNSYLLEQSYKPVSLFKAKQEEDTGIVENDQIEMVNRLENMLKNEKYYLDDELSLNQLAEYMKMRPNELTALIKKSPYENFYDLINTYRIEEVKNQLKETDEQIIQLAYQNGFRSKSTFNKIFKEKTGMTPKQYRLS